MTFEKLKIQNRGIIIITLTRGRSSAWFRTPACHAGGREFKSRRPRVFFMPFFVYIIQSLSTRKFYIGQTNNLEERLRRHNTGRSKYTRNKGPWKLVGFKTFETRKEAMSFERKLKRLSREEALRKILL